MTDNNYKNSVPSPYNKPQEKLSPIQEEVNKNIMAFNIQVQIEEDKEMISQFKSIPNFIAFKTTLRKDNEIIGIGSGVGVINKLNKFVERTVIFTKNASLIDAMVRSVKIIDSLCCVNPNNQENTGMTDEVEHASDKQKAYLRKLINVNVTDESKRKYWESQVDELTKEECSQKIQSFINN